MIQSDVREQLELLRSDHGAAVLAFELANREYFAASVSDRGDEFFERFSEEHSTALAEQEAGACMYHVLLKSDESVAGRFNLYRIADGSAEVGYRLAESVAGRGIATTGLRMLCRLAAERYGLRTVTAKTRDANVASARVLEKAGFVPMGPTTVADRPGTWYECRLDAL